MSGHLAELQPDAVLLHIGPHKTGTSAIQSVADLSRESLLAHGVTYPGLEPAHHLAAKAIRQVEGGWSHDAQAPPDPAAWTDLAQEVAGTPGRVLLSSEFFAQADAQARARLVHDLGPERLHIIAAARNPVAIAVSTWQQVLRQGYPVSLEDWLKQNFYRTEAPAQPHGFWAFADAATLVSQWAEQVNADRITVVVLDERDRRLLPTTFEQLLGLPEGLLADVTPPDVNRSLSAAEAALLRQVLQTLDSRLSWDQYSRVMRYGVIMRLRQLRKPGPDEPNTRPPGRAIQQAADEAERSITGLRESGARIVGELDSLRPSRTESNDTAPITHVPLDVAAEAVVGAVSVAVYRNWTLDTGPRPTPAPSSRRVDAIPARELAGILVKRLGVGLRRRFARQRSQRSRPPLSRSG